MSTLVATAVVATAMLSNCSWNSPGRNPYRGSVSAAVTRYMDIPAPARTALIAKIEAGRADDTASISRSGITGKFDYGPQITGMHFGERTVCENITRDKWLDTAREQAKVYCVDDHCLIVPQVCGNISRVRRLPAAAGGGTRGEGAGPGVAPPAYGAAPAPAYVASPDDVAMADAMARVAGFPDTAMVATAAFSSPGGGGAAFSPAPADRNPGAGPELAHPAPVPEPATLGMLAGGLALVYGMARLRAVRKARKSATAR